MNFYPKYIFDHFSEKRPNTQTLALPFAEFAHLPQQGRREEEASSRHIPYIYYPIPVCGASRLLIIEVEPSFPPL